VFGGGGGGGCGGGGMFVAGGGEVGGELGGGVRREEGPWRYRNCSASLGQGRCLLCGGVDIRM